MNILLFGKNGQVGWELQRSLATLGNVIALDRESVEHCGDFSNLVGLAQTVREIKPSIIVNASAHTAVDKAESEPDLAHTLNAQAPSVLAQEALKINACLLHYSTDYVFDGSGVSPWKESDLPAPLNVYGQSKYEGEQLIKASGVNHLIFRTSWVYAARGNNFAKTMLRLAQERDHLKVISDQMGAPTGADLLADVSVHALRALKHNPSISGLYHLVAAGETSWFGYAQFVLEHALRSGKTLKAAPNAIEAVSSDAFPTPAKRPLNSRLNTEKLQKIFDVRLPNWQLGVARMLDEII